MRLIVDSDTLAFAAAAMAEGQDETQAIWNAVNSIQKLEAQFNGLPMKFYLTGENNFRYSIYPEYKAYRRELKRPEYLEAVKNYLVSDWNAILSDGCEADDLCSIDQFQSNKMGEETLLIHVDKDLNMVPGRHWNPPLTRHGLIIKEEKEYVVSPMEAIKFFYTQMLMGDPTDGIKGVPGIGKVKAAQILDGLETEQELFEAVYDRYASEEEMLLNGQCLWVWRSFGGIWEFPKFE